LSAYNWFFKEERQKVLNLDFQSMGKEISSRWKATTIEQRKRYEGLAAEDTIRYKKEVQIFEEEQILKARTVREMSRQRETDGLAQLAMPPSVLALDSRASALFTAASERAMEEKNHPDAPQRLSPRLAPMSHHGSMEVPPFQNPSVLEMARQQQQYNKMLLANEMQTMQCQALQRRLGLASIQQGPSSKALLLEQLRRQEELALVSSFANTQRRGSDLIQQETVLNDYFRLQQDQLLRDRNSLSAFREGSMGVSLTGGFNGFSQSSQNPNAPPFASLINARFTAMQHPFLQSAVMGTGSAIFPSNSGSRPARLPDAASSMNPALPTYSGNESDRLELIRNLAQPKREDKK
jgi:hypothetical protein